MRLIRVHFAPHLLLFAGFVFFALPASAQHQHYLNAPEATPAEGKPLAPVLEGMGPIHHPITTNSSQAQRFFNQGMNLTYGFNHAEAIRSFQEALRLDPNAGMAWWGISFALGPNINDAMSAEREKDAMDALQKALASKPRLSQKERDFIDALVPRYANPTGEDREARDAAFAKSMAALAKKHPGDPDASALYADALMNTMPWEYWAKDGSPRPGTETVVATLEEVLSRFPDHIGAIHLYIHITEASSNPDRAVPGADKLGKLAPAAGHLVHMSSHTYARVGRYADAVESNALAASADESYMAQCHAQGIYPVGYYPHNIHFLWSAASMDGQSARAIESALKLASKFPMDQLQQFPGFEDFLATPLFAYVRFGRWDEILSQPAPPATALWWTAMYHYARATAYATKNNLPAAQAELEKLNALGALPKMKDLNVGFSTAKVPAVLPIASHLVAAEIVARQKQWDEAIQHLHEAVRLRDELRYNEPPTWHYSPRHNLGAILLEAGRPADAEAVYLEDLRHDRENPWGLFGLLQAYRAQGKEKEAADAQARFRKAWARADFVLTSSRF